MNPVDFAGANRRLGPPRGVSPADCGSLSIFTDGQTCMSVWQLTDEELRHIIETKQVRCWVWSGSNQPPIALEVVPTAHAAAGVNAQDIRTGAPRGGEQQRAG